MEKIYSERKVQEAFIITGTGHHSRHVHRVRHNEARLKPAVEAWLGQQGYHYEDASRDAKGGMLRVSWS